VAGTAARGRSQGGMLCTHRQIITPPGIAAATSTVTVTIPAVPDPLAVAADPTTHTSAAWRVVVRQLELWLEQMKNDSGGQ
jgi:hypothetical protein